jgi:hypothetical protein
MTARPRILTLSGAGRALLTRLLAQPVTLGIAGVVLLLAVLPAVSDVWRRVVHHQLATGYVAVVELMVDDAAPDVRHLGQHREQQDHAGDPEGDRLREEAGEEGAAGAGDGEDAGTNRHRVIPCRWPSVGSASATHHFTVPQSWELPGEMLRRASMPAAVAAASTCSTPGR